MNLPANTCADAISFFELLNVPTSGERTEDPNGLFQQLLDYSLAQDHITKLQSLLFIGRNKRIFMSNEVIEILRGINGQVAIVNRLRNTREPARNLPDIYNDDANNIIIYKNLHFSARFHQKQVLEQLPVIAQCILNFLANVH